MTIIQRLLAWICSRELRKAAVSFRILKAELRVCRAELAAKDRVIETLIDKVDSLQWDARAHTAAAKTFIAGLRESE